MLARTILAGLIALSGAADAACPTGEDLSDGIVLESHRDSTYHHRALDPDGTRIWQSTGRLGSPPDRGDASLWLYDHGLVELHLERMPRGSGISRANTFDGDISQLAPWTVGQRLQLTGTRVQSDGAYRARRIDTLEILESERIAIGGCDYDALVVAHRFQEVKPDGEIKEVQFRKKWIPELRLIAEGTWYGNSSGYRSIRTREPGDWFEQD